MEGRLPGISARPWWGTWTPILALLVVNLFLGILLVPHYGQSTDEEPNILFARASLESYQHPETPFRDPAREDKGPFYLMLWLKLGEAVGRAVPGWVFADGRHFVNFLTFQMTLVSIYGLAIRLARVPLALAAVLLFETQPVLFGHAFINQKDVPFMGFFAATVLLGIVWVDRSDEGWKGRTETEREGPYTSSWSVLREGWLGDQPRALRVAALATVLVLAVPIGRLLFNAQLHAVIEQTVQDAYRGQSWAPINELFLRLAQNVHTVGPEAYVLRATRLVDMAMAAVFVILLLAVVVFAPRFLPTWRRWFWPSVVAEVRQGARGPVPRLLIPAAAVLGMGIAVRSMTLFAAGLVVLYGLLRVGPRIVTRLALYFAVASLVAYLLWPQLWGSPIGVITSSLDRTIQFPQPHRTLFEGVILLSNDMPRTYLPHTMAIQLTLPALGLILLGTAALARSAIGRGAKATLAWVLILWAFIPFLAVVGFGVPIYNYFRHVLFMMPPLFVAAGLALERGYSLIRRSPWLSPFLVLAMILPGLVAIARLHPYEYGYFNELVGGVRGVRGRFIPDYWCTSLREAMEFVNEHAPASAAIAVTGPESNAAAFAREDLRVRDDAEMATNPDFEPWAIMACSLPTIDPDFFPDAPVLWTVEREGVPLAIVKLLATPEP